MCAPNCRQGLGASQETSDGRANHLSNHLDEDTVDCYVLGRLQGTKFAETRAHLRACEQCRRAAVQTADLLDLLLEEAQQEPPSEEDE
jgi:predicted anti-sigma-YlaC factor YlaD